MKLTKQLEKEVRQVYEAYWESLLSVKMRRFNSFLDESFRQIGTTDAEVFFNKKETTRFLKSTEDQVVGKIELRNRIIKVEPIDKFILITEQSDAYVKIDTEWTFYSKTRISSLLQKKEDGWKFIQQHVSFPDNRTQAGETIALEQIKTENLQLRDAVKRRTLELEHKNRELEIESSLERVRAVVMSMRKSDDLLNVCESVFTELRLLGFTEVDLRNTQIVINNDDKKMYHGYQYSDYIGGAISEIPYDLHPVVRMLHDRLRQSKDAFADIEISGKALDEWKAFVKNLPQKPDEKLNAATELHYYFYSVGIGALGISSFITLPEDKLAILRRLRNIFDLSYQRYADIALAEAQARETQIELALERVRARTMGMQKSEELKEVIQVVYEQFVHLNIYIEHTGFIMDYKARDDMNIWLADQHGAPSQVTIPYFDSAHWNSFNEAKEKGMDFFANNLSKSIIFPITGSR